MSRLSLLDLAFFLTESRESPKHVAGLQIFRKPPRAAANWVRKLAEEYRSHDQPNAPFDRVIDFRALGGPRWRKAAAFNIDEHLFYHRPAAALSERELFKLCARLHEPLMDRSKPMWEFHVIDNVEGGRFAIYSKMHHAYADGVTMSRWNVQSLHTSARARRLKVIWNREEAPEDRSEATAKRALFGRILRSLHNWRLILGGTSKLTAQLALEQVGLTRNAVALPFKAVEDTPLTGAVTAGRQFATAHVPMERIKRLRAMTRCTLNHIALTCLDGALRRYLADEGIELQRPLSIQMPVSLRDENDRVSGNKIGIVLVDLAPCNSDPYTRLREIGFTLRSVRNQIDGVPAIAVAQYTAVLAVLIELMQLLRLDRLLPAIADTLVSNVPGPSQPLYLKGARLEQTLPISTLPPGNQLNITLYSYCGTLHFGLVATEQVAGLERLGRYIEEAFVELEEAVFDPAA
ncbi:MAG: wax ester/triacylglycerol synthase family O-acyltransferase [Halieaceae bacterium]|jgi:WS/DGAT/MGAT family acyltransferase|nr:wax ester/triacylglycerol synthase family O-acyltransferase [Halieaceae bacterium]